MKVSSKLIRAELNRAADSLKAARNLLKDGLFADSITRSYYAVFHAARACLLHHGENPSTHKGIFMLFHQRLVRGGLIEEEFARILKLAKEERWLGDYAVEEEFDFERAEVRMTEASRFVNRAKDYLKRNLKWITALRSLW